MAPRDVCVGSEGSDCHGRVVSFPGDDKFSNLDRGSDCAML